MQRRGWLSLLAILAAFGTPAARAQNLDEGKTAPQLFAGDCQACHKSPAGLGKNASVGFLRQHYTSSARSATLLANYLATAGAGPARAERPKTGPGDQKEGREERAQRRLRDKTAVASPPDGTPGAERRKNRKTNRPGAPGPAAEPTAPSTNPAPSANTPTAPNANPPAAAAGDGATAAVTPPAYPPPLTLDAPAATSEPASERSQRPDTAAVAAAPAASPPPQPPAFAAPLP